MFPSQFAYTYESSTLLASHPATLPGWIFRNEIHPAETATIDVANRLNLGVQRQFPDHTSLGISQRMNDNERTPRFNRSATSIVAVSTG